MSQKCLLGVLGVLPEKIGILAGEEDPLLPLLLICLQHLLDPLTTHNNKYLKV
jgi:hypothetical protein